MASLFHVQYIIRAGFLSQVSQFWGGQMEISLQAYEGQQLLRNGSRPPNKCLVEDTDLPWNR
jgi:hypothetical protein